MPRKGQKMSDEQKNKIRNSHLKLKRKMSEESKQKLSQAKTGIPRDEATRKKISESLKGRSRPQAVIDKIKESKASRPWSATEETRRRMSESQKAFRQRQREAND